MPERLTGRNSGPLVIPAAAIHALTAARLQMPPVRDGDLLPAAFLVRLALADGDAQARGIVGQVRDVERRQLGAAECAGEAERQDGAVADARQGGRRVREHGGEDLGGGRRFPALGGANGAAHALGVRAYTLLRDTRPHTAVIYGR